MGQSQKPGEGPLDQPGRDAGDPIGDDAYPGASGLLPPTGDMDYPTPSTGFPGEPTRGEQEANQLDEEEGVDRRRAR